MGARRRPARLMTRLLLLVAMTYCLPKPQPELQAPPCSGRRVIAVANNGDITVDVHVRTAPGPSIVVGGIRPGDRAEFAVPDAGRVSIRPTGFLGGDLRPDERVRIDAQYHCRQA